MGAPTSEVGYTNAMPRREDHEVHKDMWWGKKISEQFRLPITVLYHSAVKKNINSLWFLSVAC
jgi:hypothetical protein